MALTQIDFEKGEEDKLHTLQKKWGLNRPKTIKRMVREFKE